MTFSWKVIYAKAFPGLLQGMREGMQTVLFVKSMSQGGPKMKNLRHFAMIA